jgi:hypothetical protein
MMAGRVLNRLRTLDMLDTGMPMATLRMSIMIVALGMAVPVSATAAGVTQPTSYVIHADHRLGTFVTGGPDATLPTAVSTFGTPSSVRRHTSDCVARWASIGLQMTFIFGTSNPCVDGVFIAATINGKMWRTALGLRVGASATSVAARYPHATYHSSGGPTAAGWWLIVRHQCKMVGGPHPPAYPSLLTRVSGKRISAFVIQFAACD